jgi:hypothetical protein
MTMAKRQISKRAKIIAALVLVTGIALAGGGASWVYIHLIAEKQPPKFSFEQRDKDLSTTTVVQK